jgi:hypothetical protein
LISVLISIPLFAGGSEAHTMDDSLGNLLLFAFDGTERCGLDLSKSGSMA